MSKEIYLQMKKQLRIWTTINIIIALIAIIGGILVIISKSRHIPFYYDAWSTYFNEPGVDYACF